VQLYAFGVLALDCNDLWRRTQTILPTGSADDLTRVDQAVRVLIEKLKQLRRSR
jgi:hypothetical protein